MHTNIPHGKGVVDGVGGNVKSTIRRKCMLKGKDRVVVQDSSSFAKEAAQLVPPTKILHFPSDIILQYESTDPFKESKPVEGISSMHIMSVKYDYTKLWHNAVECHSSIPSISTSVQPDFNEPLNEPFEIVEN